jgi:hypothetical protein
MSDFNVFAFLLLYQTRAKIQHALILHFSFLIGKLPATDYDEKCYKAGESHLFLSP